MKILIANALFGKELYHYSSWYIIFFKALKSVSIRAMNSILIMEGIYELYFTEAQLQHLDPRWQILRISHEWDCLALKRFGKQDHYNEINCWWHKPLKNPSYDNGVQLWSTYMKHWAANVLHYLYLCVVVCCSLQVEKIVAEIACSAQVWEFNC